MELVNRTARKVAYELKGGPLMMTMSTCELAPGETERWSSPYRRQRLDVDLEVIVQVADGPELTTKAGDRDRVEVVADGDDYVLQVRKALP